MLGSSRPKLIDLFCGCSGLGLGASQAGFDVACSVDVDPVLTSSHALNFPGGNLLLRDISTVTGAILRDAVGGEVDGIVGGPPCQGFSEIGRSDPQDPRRDLLTHFFRLVRETRPRFFLMENVRGLGYPKNRSFLDAALDLVATDYSILGPMILEASEFGAATKRPRLFVLGFDRNRMERIDESEILAAKRPAVTVEQAIADLRGALQVEKVEGFDQWRLGPISSNASSYASLLRSPDGVTTGLRKTPHRPEIAERFAAVRPGSVDKVGRHPRLAWNGQCPTLRAGTGPEFGSRQAVRPLHPDEPRVITVREAARLQGFPDWFRFHPTVWHSFRMIGNSVSPIAAHALLELVFRKIVNRYEAQAAE